MDVSRADGPRPGRGVSAEPAAGLLCWLPAALPADVRRIAAREPEVAATLANAGATITTDGPDVEIANDTVLRGGAPIAVISVGQARMGGHAVAGRLARRVLSVAETALAARRAEAALRRAGYPHVRRLVWDIDRSVRVPWAHSRPRGRSELLPARAVVTGHSGEPPPTVLQAALAAASDAVGRPLRPERVLARTGALVVPCDGYVVRVTIGPSRDKLVRQGVILRALGDPAVPGLVADRVPHRVGEGRVGIADWAVETRLAGAPPRRLTSTLIADALEFLTALFTSPIRSGTPSDVSGDAALVAAACPSLSDAEIVIAVAAHAERTLADLPRGVAHGDFWRENLLVRDGRLHGVIDWESASPGRLPGIDLMQMLVSDERVRSGRLFGPTVVDYLMPWADADGDALLRAYARRLAAPLEGARLRALTAAFWLDHVAFELRGSVERTRQPVWLDRNITHVVAALRRHGWVPAGGQ